MAPKRSVMSKHLRGQHSSVTESTDARWRRLRPDLYWEPEVEAVATPVPKASRGTRARPPQSAADPVHPPFAQRRLDEPVIRFTRRGTTTDALAALKVQGVTALVDVLYEGRYSKSATASNLSLLKTWQHFHDQAFAHEHPLVPYLPLTARILVIIGALFKAGGYRSYPNYVAIVKSRHIDAGHEWSHMLQHTSSWITRSVLRGIGPERQSCCFDVQRLFALPRTSAPLVIMGPSNPYHLSLLAVLFLLREIEVTTARVGAWSLSDVDQTITWHLPASKSDHLALGVQRTLPCMCGLEALPCPYHLALEHIQWLRSSGHPDEDSSPLFPTSTGAVASKRSVVLTFEVIGTLCGQPLLSDHGLRLFGGHTPRVTGAQLYAQLGLEVNKIRLLARHSGDTILRYVQDAPLKSILADLGIAARLKATSSSTRSVTLSSKDSRRITTLEATVEELNRTLQAQAVELDSLNEAASSKPILTFIQNDTTATIHQSSPKYFGRTRCGITFDGPTFRARRQKAAATYTVVPGVTDMPCDLICERCLPAEHKAAKERDLIHDEVSGDEEPIDVQTD